MDLSLVFFIIIAVVAANLPFFSERIFFVLRPASGVKHWAWRLAEVIALYFAVGGIGLLLESRVSSIHAQGWEFYLITFCLFLVCAYPGLVARYLWRSRP